MIMIRTCRNPFPILTFLVSYVALCSPHFLRAQATSPAKLSVHWEELTASDFREGIHAFREKRHPVWPSLPK